MRWRADLADPGAVGKDEPRIEGCAIEAGSGIRSFDFYAGITWARCLQADRLDPPTRGGNRVREELVKGLHELLWRPRLDDVAVGQTVAKQLAEAPGLPDDYTSGLVEY